MKLKLNLDSKAKVISLIEQIVENPKISNELFENFKKQNSDKKPQFHEFVDRLGYYLRYTNNYPTLTIMSRAMEKNEENEIAFLGLVLRSKLMNKGKYE